MRADGFISLSFPSLKDVVVDRLASIGFELIVVKGGEKVFCISQWRQSNKVASS